MSDGPQMKGWRQATDGQWYPPEGPMPSPPAHPEPSGQQGAQADEQTVLLRRIAKDLATVRGIVVFWTVVYLIGIVIVIVTLNNASNSLKFN